MLHLGSPITPKATGNLYLKHCICCFRALLSGLAINQHTASKPIASSKTCFFTKGEILHEKILTMEPFKTRPFKVKKQFLFNLSKPISKIYSEMYLKYLEHYKTKSENKKHM